MIIQKLEQKKEFSAIEIEIANYILENGEKVKDMPIQKLAEETFSSPATIVRLCKKMGVKGYQEFRIKFYAEHEEASKFRKRVDTNVPFEKHDSYETIVTNLGNIVINTIQDTMRSFDLRHIYRIMNRMQSANEFYVFGEGSSVHAAIEFKTKMLRLGKVIFLEESRTHQKALAINAREDAFSIVISYSGETRMIIDLVEMLKEKKRYILAITSDPESTIAKMANDILLIDSSEEKSLGDKMETFTSHNSAHFVLDCLYSFYFRKNYDENIGLLKKNAMRIKTL